MPRMSGSWRGDTAAAPLTDGRDRLRPALGGQDLGRVDACMAQMLRHPIDACTAAQRLDRVHMAKVMEAERNARRRPMDCLCEGRRDRNPRAVRRWKDQVAAPIEAADRAAGDRVMTRRRLPLPLIISSVPAASLNCGHFSAVNSAWRAPVKRAAIARLRRWGEHLVRTA
jgi:hypothetical protein